MTDGFNSGAVIQLMIGDNVIHDAIVRKDEPLRNSVHLAAWRTRRPPPSAWYVGSGSWDRDNSPHRWVRHHPDPDPVLVDYTAACLAGEVLDV